jgi:hypothetical protein
MARMIPDIDPSSIENSGEKEMYRQLRDQLPPTWVVRYHFPACWKEGRMLRECESDFIVLAPKMGLMLIEVKGSHGFHFTGGQCFRVKPDGQEERINNPFHQATATKHMIVGRIADRVFGKTKNEFPGIFGHLVAYPFGRRMGPTPSSTEKCMLLAYADMPQLRQKLESAYLEWGTPERGAAFGAAELSKVEQFLSNEGGLVPVLAAGADDDAARIDELTRWQFRAFRGIIGNPRVHVRGPAGSGKTLLALWAAQEKASQGKRVLLLCFNRVLSAWLRNKQGAESRIEIKSFFVLCRETVLAAGAQFDVPQEDSEKADFWCNTAPKLFCEAIENYSEAGGKYDAILVDEAQDFHADWWFPTLLLLKDPDRGQLTLFSDPIQAGVYGRGNSFPEGLVSFELHENCRNTKRITEFCGKVIEQEISSFGSSPQGVFPEIRPVATDPTHRGKAVQALIGQWLDEGFSAARIAVLSPWNPTERFSAMTKQLSIRGYPLRGDQASLEGWTTGKLIWCSTIKAFKGLEADCVIIADAPSPTATGRFGIPDFYVAASRAKHRLVIFPTTPEAKSEIERWCHGLRGEPISLQ